MNRNDYVWNSCSPIILKFSYLLHTYVQTYIHTNKHSYNKKRDVNLRSKFKTKKNKKARTYNYKRSVLLSSSKEIISLKTTYQSQYHNMRTKFIIDISTLAHSDKKSNAELNIYLSIYCKLNALPMKYCLCTYCTCTYSCHLFIYPLYQKAKI